LKVKLKGQTVLTWLKKNWIDLFIIVALAATAQRFIPLLAPVALGLAGGIVWRMIRRRING